MLPPYLSWTPRTSGMSSSCNSFTSRRTWNVSSVKCVKPTGHQTSHAFQVISSQVISLHLLRLPNPLQLLMVWSRPSPLGDPPVFVGGKSCYDNSPNDTRQHWWTSTGLATYGAYLKFCCDFLFGHRKNHHLFFGQPQIHKTKEENYNQRSKQLAEIAVFLQFLYTVGFRLVTQLAPRQLLRSGKNCTRSLVCGTMMCWMFTICSTEAERSVTIGWDVRDVDELSGVSTGWILGDLNWYCILWFKIKLQRSSGIFFHDVPSQAIINQVCPKVLSTNLTFCSFQSPPFISTLNPCLGKGHIGPYTIIQWLHG